MKYPVTILTISDADTFTCTITQEFVGLGVSTTVTVTVRAYGYDACETSRVRKGVEITDEEITAGKLAAASLIALNRSFGLLIEPTGRKDKYGRTLAVCYFGDGLPVADWMRANRFTRETLKHGASRTARRQTACHTVT